MKKSEVNSKLAKISLISISIFSLIILLVSVIWETLRALTPPLLITSYAINSYSWTPRVPACFIFAK